MVATSEPPIPFFLHSSHSSFVISLVLVNISTIYKTPFKIYYFYWFHRYNIYLKLLTNTDSK